MTKINEIVKLIEGSGNNFHAKVARWFSTNGWHVVVSPYYLDRSQGKAREIDLVVEKIFPIKDYFGQTVNNFVIRLFVECKYIASNSVFWFAEKDFESAKKLVSSTNIFKESNAYTSKHHYLSEGNSVAKLFSSNNNGNSENDPFYKALNQVLHAMISMQGQPSNVARPKDRLNRPKFIIDYPVVVCSSFEKLYAVNFYTESEPVNIASNFQLEVLYAYVDKNDRHKNEYFLLDFVSFAALGDFVSSIEKDSEIAGYLASET